MLTNPNYTEVFSRLLNLIQIRFVLSAEVDGFFSGRKNPEHKSSGRDFKPGVQSLRFQAR